MTIKNSVYIFTYLYNVGLRRLLFMSFINWLLQEPAGQFFVRVDDHFIQEHANDADIAPAIGSVEGTLKLLLAGRPGDAGTEKARLLYGLLHRKYLLTEEGARQMIARQQAGHFPPCRRVFCHKHTCLPMGLSDKAGSDMVLFCPNCSDVYAHNAGVAIDGSFFGSEWIHHLVRNHSEIIPKTPPEVYEPRVYGFKVFLQRK